MKVSTLKSERTSTFRPAVGYMFLSMFTVCTVNFTWQVISFVSDHINLTLWVFFFKKKGGGEEMMEPTRCC